jgi:hypothetical protein
MMVAFDAPKWLMSCCSLVAEAVSSRNTTRLPSMRES